MLLGIIFLVVGLALILLGANYLTDGASAIAKSLGVSDLVVGLTVVAMGTSAPELAISVLSAINGSAALAIGNVVGSNVFNTLMIIGVTALVAPIKIKKTVMTNEIPLTVLAAVALAAIGLAPVLNGGGTAIITRVDGILLLLFMAIFMRYTLAQAHSGSAPAPAEEPRQKPMAMWKSLLFVVGGLAALIYGGDRFVAGASGVARGLGASEALIGLTIVAIGTSAPELAASIAAALKGMTGMALGNVIGSNIFNIFLVLGTSATIRELPFGNIGAVDLGVLLVSALLFWMFGWLFGNRVITRVEGAVMILAYLGYMTYLLVA